MSTTQWLKNEIAIRVDTNYFNFRRKVITPCPDGLGFLADGQYIGNYKLTGSSAPHWLRESKQITPDSIIRRFILGGRGMQKITLNTEIYDVPKRCEITTNKEETEIINFRWLNPEEV